MRIAALLDPEILQMELLAVAVGPEQVGIALARGDDIFIINEWDDPFLLGPNPRPIRIDVLADTFVEELDPRRGCTRTERRHVVAHLKQIAAGRTTVNDLHETVLPRATVDALKQ